MSWLPTRLILFICLSIFVAQMAAMTDNTINKSYHATSPQNIIGSGITPIFSMDTLDPQVTVLSPNGGETWPYGTQKNILWSADDSNFITTPISIQLSIDNGQNFSMIEEDISNSGDYLWTIPNILGVQSLIRIIAVDAFGNSGDDVSNISFYLTGTTVSITPIFSIDTIDPVVDLIVPDGAEIWNIGEENAITWTAMDSHFSSTPIFLEFTSGSVWSTIISACVNSGEYLWTVPGIVTDSAMVRIHATDLFGNTAMDISQNPFMITSSVPAMVENVRLEAIDDTNVSITWDPVVLSDQGYPITPSGYFILANPSNEPWNMSSYYILGITDTYTTNFIHQDVLANASHFFYRIIAVKNSKAIADARKLISSSNSPVRYVESELFVQPAVK